jgi:peptidoglycan/xylan/chitin deacetylase (PgdA/CDA1 family)
MDILASRGVRAAFFVIGKWVERWPKALEFMVQAGHVIGNHSYLHFRNIGDFDRAEATITAITGKPSRFLRPHYLDNFATALHSPLAMSQDIRIIWSDVNPADYKQTEPHEIVRRVLESPHLAGGSIIDLHDGSEVEDDAARLSRPIPMIKALPDVVDGLTDQGYQIVGLDELEYDGFEEWHYEQK